ncbi:hypothetical protein L486_06197 [Kwoniella mangroviensis CBS 10435]|uniref:Uncharacterized protein n=1 Tax=Kwoniella mangroviensis CBS 10435 TaxID=1331196 RepID=A0A1B9IKU8_9TREE|nr:uncharacterized protein I203_05906 [Kwoniella mangroviensis CBS 8507]OCF56256.1 hypothetical protein L486_06197 [Kwoniella mangroviensis CBS 10435]OCF65164.1 hypothetical protein I203_05906 [Kwoniella mangroviensis CBS 8507]
MACHTYINVFPVCVLLSTLITLRSALGAPSPPQEQDIRARQESGEEGVQLMKTQGPSYKDIKQYDTIGDFTGIKNSLAALALHPPPKWVDDHIVDLTNGVGQKGMKTTNGSFLLHNITSQTETEEGGRKSFLYDIVDVKSKYSVEQVQDNWWWQGLELALLENMPSQLSSDFIDRTSPSVVLNMLTGLQTESINVKDISDDEYMKILNDNKDKVIVVETTDLAYTYYRIILDVKSDTEITSTELYGEKWAVPYTCTSKDLRQKYGGITLLKY